MHNDLFNFFDSNTWNFYLRPEHFRFRFKVISGLDLQFHVIVKFISVPNTFLSITQLQ